MRSRKMLLVLVSTIIFSTSVSAQVDDVRLLLRSGIPVEGDVTSYTDGLITMEYEKRYGYSGEFSTILTVDFSIDTLRTVHIGGSTSATSTFLLSTLAGLGLGIGLAVGNGGPLAGLAIIFGGGLGLLVGAVSAIILTSSATDMGTYSPAIAHDAELLSKRLISQDADIGWGSEPNMRSVRESVPHMQVHMKSGHAYEGWLIDASETEVTFLVDDESLEDADETVELRTIPYSEITFVGKVAISNSGYPIFQDWYPGEQSVEVLRAISFAATQ